MKRIISTLVFAVMLSMLLPFSSSMDRLWAATTERRSLPEIRLEHATLLSFYTEPLGLGALASDLDRITTADLDQLKLFAPAVVANDAIHQFTKEEGLVAETAQSLIVRLLEPDLETIKDPAATPSELLAARTHFMELGRFFPYYLTANELLRAREAYNELMQRISAANLEKEKETMGGAERVGQALAKETGPASFDDFVQQDGRIAFIKTLGARGVAAMDRWHINRSPMPGFAIGNLGKYGLPQGRSERMAQITNIALRDRNLQVQQQAVHPLISNAGLAYIDHFKAHPGYEENLDIVLAELQRLAHETTFADIREKIAVFALHATTIINDPSHWHSGSREPLGVTPKLWALYDQITVEHPIQSGIWWRKGIESLEKHLMAHRLSPNTGRASTLHNYLMDIERKLKALKDAGFGSSGA